MSSDGPLSLHVPEPAVRPGGVPDFSNITIPQAGYLVSGYALGVVVDLQPLFDGAAALADAQAQAAKDGAGEE